MASLRKIAPDDLKLDRVFHYHQKTGSHPNPFQIQPYHECAELVTGGRGWVEEKGIWREVIPGHIVWNKPGDFTIGRSDFVNPYRCLAIQFRTTKRKGLGIKRISICPDPEAVAAFADEAIKLFVDEGVSRSVLGNYLAGRLMLWVHRHSLDKGRMGLPPGVQRALEWIELHYADACPVEQIARQAGWSSAYLHHMFRHFLGITPHQALRQRRLRAAREQLVSTSHSVKRIAVECGFADSSALIHAFRADLQTTPKNYRLQQAGMGLRAGNVFPTEGLT